MSKISFERKILTAILPWQKACAACDIDFEVGDEVYIVIMANGKTRWTFDKVCLEQVSGFMTIALLSTGEEEIESLVN